MTISWLLKPSFGSVVITILMTLQMSACNMEAFAEAVADNIVSDTSNISSDTSDTSGTNQAAVISGTDNGSVTEDYDPDADNLLEIGGKLNITDSDTGEAAFIATTHNGDYGNLTIDATGSWNYAANNNHTVIQNLTSSDSLKDHLTISSVDGTTHTVVITIIGADEVVNTVADVSLSWVAPSEREDNTGIDLSEIAGYKVYYGTTQGDYTSSIDINDHTAVGHTFNNFSAGTYYFVVTTFDTEGRESQYSSEVKIII